MIFMADDRLIVGLGNPGSEYEYTRHNAGFLAIDSFARHHGCQIDRQRWQGLCCRQNLLGRPVILLKPQTYMNRSGESVARFADFFRISPRHILVVHDDLDLPAGRIKVVARGGAGGHKGIRSLISHLHTTHFPRIKIGIGRPANPVPVERWVLSKFDQEGFSVFERQLELVEQAVALFIEQGIDECMNRCNRRSSS